MNTKLTKMVSEIKNQQDYIENNEDWLNDYYDIVPDLFTYNNQNVVRVVSEFIENHYDIEFNESFINELIEDQITYYDQFVNLKGCNGYYSDNKQLFSIDLGEQEIFFNEENLVLSEDEKCTIEKETGAVINNSNQLCYQIIYSHLNVNIVVPELLEYLNNLEAIKMMKLLKQFDTSYKDALKFLSNETNQEIFKLEIDNNKIIFSDDSVIVFEDENYKLGAK